MHILTHCNYVVGDKKFQEQLDFVLFLFYFFVLQLCMNWKLPMKNQIYCIFRW